MRPNKAVRGAYTPPSMHCDVYSGPEYQERAREREREILFYWRNGFLKRSIGIRVYNKYTMPCILFHLSNYVPYYHILTSSVKEQSRKVNTSHKRVQRMVYHCLVITQRGALCELALKYRQLKQAKCKTELTKLSLHLSLATMSACLLNNGLQSIKNLGNLPFLCLYSGCIFLCICEWATMY